MHIDHKRWDHLIGYLVYTLACLVAGTILFVTLALLF